MRGEILVLQLALGAALVSACCNEAPTLDSAPLPATEGAVGEVHFVTPEVLPAMDAVVLDARDLLSFHQGHIPGARHAPWTAFVDGHLTGELAPTHKLQALLRELGVNEGQAVVVYGDWRDGWGEEGRLYWMLRFLGHPHVRVLAGGMPRWRALGEETASVGGEAPLPGDFRVAPSPGHRASTEDVIGATAPGSGTVILDVRSSGEYNGSTPYGSSRGGHIPGARHLHWKDLFHPSGRIHTREQLSTLLKVVGVDTDTEVIVYCTGGVRSAFTYLVLQWWGATAVRNYDASWWAWSARDELAIERRGSPAN